MANEEKISEQIKIYQEAAKQNPKVDISALMLQALENTEHNRLSSKQKHWAYLISIGVPPFGLIFAAKFWFMDGDKEDAQSAAITCIVLTVLAILLVWVFMKAFLSTSGTNLQQIEQINPQDVIQLTQ